MVNPPPFEKTKKRALSIIISENDTLESLPCQQVARCILKSHMKSMEDMI